MGRLRPESGQILIIVLAIMIIASTLVPLLVFYSQREAVWTAKQAKSTTAFHLAEAGIEKGYLEISLSTLTWVNLQAGTTPTDYNFDKKYSDTSGGYYAISVTSGPQSQQATIISIGKDSLGREVRSLQAVYSNVTAGNIAIMGVAGVDVSGNNMSVEWGGIISPQAITPNGQNHPSYWSASNVIGFDTNGSAPPNCDQPNCWWWHSYYAGVPPTPLIDFNFYKSSAQSAGASPCGMTYYQSGSHSGGCNDLTGNTFYLEGDWTSFDGPIIGTVITMGNLAMYPPNGAKTGHTIAAPLPQQAWKQYCNDWAYYRSTYDGGVTNPYVATCPGLSSTYLSSAGITKSITPVVNGLLYIGGNFTGPNGGGGTDLGYGVMIVKGTVNLNSNSPCKWYYSAIASAALQTTQIILTRSSWKDVFRTWPSNL